MTLNPPVKQTCQRSQFGLPDIRLVLCTPGRQLQPEGTPQVPGVPGRGQRHVGEVRGAAGVGLQGDDGAGVWGDGEVQHVFVGDGQLGAHAGHAADGDVVAAVQDAARHAQARGTAGREPEAWAEVAGGVKAAAGEGGGFAEAVGGVVVQRQGGGGVVLIVRVQDETPVGRVLVAGLDGLRGVDLQRGDARVLGRPAVAVLLQVRVAFLRAAAVDGHGVHGCAGLDAALIGMVVHIGGVTVRHYAAVFHHGSSRQICKQNVMYDHFCQLRQYIQWRLSLTHLLLWSTLHFMLHSTTNQPQKFGPGG